jgi:protein-disulfide isomerase
VPQIAKEYIETGKVKYVLLDFPLPFHKNAFKAAEAAHCAGEQGKYWEMHDQLFANQNALDPKKLSEYAKKIELDIPKFEQCLDSGKYAEEIKKDMAEGQKAGVTGVPAFLMGVTDQNNPKTLKATEKIVGAQPYAKFKETIDSLLAPQK